MPAISKGDRERHCRAVARLLLDPSRREEIILSGFVPSSVPAGPGVYAIFHGTKPIYIGQAKNLHKRYLNLRRPERHVLRNKLGARFSGVQGQSKLSPRGLPESVELRDKINIYMSRRLQISYVSVTFGRLEIEEWLVKKLDPQYNE